jgi:hypothetical protein
MMSGLVFEKLLQTMAAGQDWRLNIAGDFFRLSGAQWPVSVALVKDLRIVGVMANMLAGDYVRDIDFDGVIVTNGSVGQDVSVQIAGGGAGSDRVMGEVSVISGELVRVKAGMCFVGTGVCGGVAGNYSPVQLWNPAGSGKRVVINRLVTYSTVAGQGLYVGITNSALATVSGNIANKLAGGAVGVAQLRQANSVSAPASPVYISAVQVAGEAREMGFSEPIILPEGFGAVVWHSNQNAQNVSAFQWIEE